VGYATTSDVQARLPGFTLTATSQPTLAQVAQWIVEAEAMLDGALVSAGLSAPNTDARGVEILKSWACDYAEGHARTARASEGGDGANDDGRALIEAFRDLIKNIPSQAGSYAQMLQAGAAAGRRVRGYAIDNDDGRTIANGDFAPAFTKSAAEDQW